MTNKIYLSVCLVATLAVLTTSCKKTKTEIQTNTIHDTVQVRSVDTTLAMATAGWTLYSHDLQMIVPAGPTTFFTTAEGLKFIAQGVRRGARLQTKNELGFYGKTIYVKWKATGGGQFAQVVIQVKYDPTTYDALPPIQGADFTNFTLTSPFNGYPVVQSDTWYYTRIRHITGTDNFQVVTSTGNYDNSGGTMFQSLTVPVYTTHGYLAIRLGDNYAGSGATLTLGEYRIKSN
jgi:hypothetical protein